MYMCVHLWMKVARWYIQDDSSQTWHPSHVISWMHFCMRKCTMVTWLKSKLRLLALWQNTWCSGSYLYVIVPRFRSVTNCALEMEMRSNQVVCLQNAHWSILFLWPPLQTLRYIVTFVLLQPQYKDNSMDWSSKAVYFKQSSWTSCPAYAITLTYNCRYTQLPPTTRLGESRRK